MVHLLGYQVVPAKVPGTVNTLDRPEHYPGKTQRIQAGTGRSRVFHFIYETHPWIFRRLTSHFPTGP